MTNVRPAVISLLFLALLLLPPPGDATARAQALGPQGALVRVVILSRHGVRSPTQSTEVLNSWRNTKTPGWPDFGVPPSYLTPKGGSWSNRWGNITGLFSTSTVWRTRRTAPTAS